MTFLHYAEQYDEHEAQNSTASTDTGEAESEKMDI
mgnify:CR=1 FL=1